MSDLFSPVAVLYSSCSYYPCWVVKVGSEIKHVGRYVGRYSNNLRNEKFLTDNVC